MLFTALHRLLGEAPGPITDALIDAAIAAGLTETDDLDWKAALPPTKGLAETDFPKDIAAMANSGGGVIVYGIEESEKRATGRKAVSLTENHERTLRAAALSSIAPPVFGLEIWAVGNPGNQVVALVVPASVDGPHLIYRDQFFGAPIRNDADTVWMKERQIEQTYRARFDERSHSAEALTNLRAEAGQGRDSQLRAWLIAVARPRVPFTPPERPSKEDVQKIVDRARNYTLNWIGSGGVHPIVSLAHNPRPGLRRWNLINSADGKSVWRESWAAIHHDGSVTLATAIGGQRTNRDELPGWQISAQAIEAAVADFMALVRAVSDHHGLGEYEVQVAIDYDGPKSLLIVTIDGNGFRYDGTSVPLTVYSPVSTTVQAGASSGEFYRQMYALAEDCVNQGGISNLLLIPAPPES